jgi:hypothetical protein
MRQILMLEDQAETKVMVAMHNLRARKLVDLPGMTIIVLKVHKVADLPEMKPIPHLPEPRADLATLLLHQMAAEIVAVGQLEAEAVAVQDHQEQEEVNLNLNTQHEKIYFSFTSSYSSCYGNNVRPKLRA